MKHSRLILLIVLTLILGVSAFAQRKFNGTVVEIVDGKTVVVEMPTGGKITVELQYIEVPEPEQQLHRTVREHLQQMVYGKQVEFLARGVAETKTVGQVFLNGVDVSQQMLRDGAAWHVSSEKSGQDQAQTETYQNNEAQAKAEKRGVWSIENLQPAWEFRAQKRHDIKSQPENVELEKTGNQTQTISTSNSRTRRWTVEEQLKANAANVQMWGDARSANATDANKIVSDGSGETSAGGLLSNYFSSTRIGYTSTPSSFINVSSGASRAKLDHRAFYVYRGDQSSGVERDVFMLGFASVAQGAKFAQANSLTIIADKQKFVFAKLVRLYQELPHASVEILFYKVTPAELRKIAAAKSVQIKIGQHSGAMGNDSRAALKDLLKATN
ncbi:MAG: thermonuclease family protein [Acidobacteriota bacterium]|nr:thermonuclease family protein [Acidobacteriota bacterium]